MSAPVTTTAQQLRDDVRPVLRSVWEAWAAALPPEAPADWRRGCAYVRESSIVSLASNAPETQLRNTLANLAAKHVYVPWEGIFFDNASGTDIALRAEFQRLFEEALAGGFEVVGVFVAERMFRNLEQATRIKREFRLHGIDLEYLGRFEGDPRNPASWQLEVMQDMSAELQARTTGFYVGTHIESLTRAGHPVGMLPEAYVVAERAPSFMGHQGSAVRWSLVQPLASVIDEGRRRYVAGASYAELGRWSETTILAGSTPSGSRMSAWWWRATLQNPKYAGYHMPTAYQGFRPGKESKKRPRRNRDSELVPCRLPALWTLDDYHAILETATKRHVGAKARPSYRAYLLTGIAVDARCGHRMSVHSKEPDGRFSMGCRHLGTAGRDHPLIRADVAERELDELLARVSFGDEVLRRQVEEEVRELARHEAGVDQLRPNPAIAMVRRAIGDLRNAGIEDAGLARRLEELERTDSAQRDTRTGPVREFSAAAERLRDWAAVWSAADLAVKNELLRAAGLHVTIGRDPGESVGPAHVQSVSADNPTFALALATALLSPDRTFEGQKPSFHSNAQIVIELSGPAITAARRAAILTAESTSVRTARPSVEAGAQPVRRQPPTNLNAYGPARWRRRIELDQDDPMKLYTIAQTAVAVGSTPRPLYSLLSRGAFRAIRVGRRRRRVLVPQPELEVIRQHVARLGTRADERLVPAA